MTALPIHHASSSSALEWAGRVLNACKENSLEIFRTLIREGFAQGFLNQKLRYFNNQTALHRVAQVADAPSYVSAFFELGVIDTSIQDDSLGNTALMWAIANANNAAALEIIRHGGSSTFLDIQCREQGNTALHLAVGKGYTTHSAEGEILACSNLEIVKALIRARANVNVANKKGNTPLHLACLHRDPAMIKALLQAGADRSKKNKAGFSPQELLTFSYEKAQEILKSTVVVFLLDSEDHAGNLEEASEVFAEEQTSSETRSCTHNKIYNGL